MEDFESGPLKISLSNPYCEVVLVAGDKESSYLRTMILQGPKS
jgi:hypothetical protein